MQVMQVLPRHRPPMLGRVTVGQREADRAADGVRAPIPAMWRWLVWSWPTEGGPWVLPGGHLTTIGAVIEAALPAEGSAIERYDVRWRVANQPGLTLPAAPVWVSRLLAGRI